MSISKIFIPTSLSVFSKIKDRKHIEQNTHSVARVMPRGGTCGCWGSQNFSVGICDGAPSTARSSLQLYLKCQLRFSHNYPVLSLIIHDVKTVISNFMSRHQTLKF